MFIKFRVIEDKRLKFKDIGECWLIFINLSMVLRKKEKVIVSWFI